MNICANCKENPTLLPFSSGRKRYYCGDCQTQRAAESYQRNKKARINEQYSRAAAGRLFVNELKNKPCVDCGITYPACCMDFDHRDPSKKDRNVSQLVKRSKTKILAEIEKCDLVCANCHRIRTFANGRHKSSSRRA